MQQHRHVFVILTVAVGIASPAALGESAVSATTPPDTLAVSADNDHLFTMGDVVVPPGTPGELAVVLTGPAEGASVPVIVRNTTDAPTYGVEASGIARDAGGGLVATGSSRRFDPTALQPGEWAIGSVDFDIDELTGEETFEFLVTGQTDPARFSGRIDLTVTEAVLQPGESNDRVVGIVTNETDTESGGPNGVSVACFDGPSLVGIVTGFTDTDVVAPGGIAPFTVDLDDIESCPSMAIASSGFD